MLSVRDYPGNGFDPSFFEAEDYSFFNRSSEATWRRALTQFWYPQNFTQKTQMGQLAVLRDPKVSSRWGFHTTVRLLRKIYVLLWILLALISLVVIRLLGNRFGIGCLTWWQSCRRAPLVDPLQDERRLLNRLIDKTLLRPGLVCRLVSTLKVC